MPLHPRHFCATRVLGNLVPAAASTPPFCPLYEAPLLHTAEALVAHFTCGLVWFSPIVSLVASCILLQPWRPYSWLGPIRRLLLVTSCPLLQHVKTCSTLVWIHRSSAVPLPSVEPTLDFLSGMSKQAAPVSVHGPSLWDGFCIVVSAL